MDRRDFLALGGLAAVAAGQAAGRNSSAPLVPFAAASSGQLLMRRIPSTGETLPAIGLGTSGPFEVGADAARELRCAKCCRHFSPPAPR